uniref:Epoxide hydrolase 2 n=1 Tax=Anthurium amnicola TaxID=1678845 RepID=A0A1D1XEA1_9ARAE
MAAGKGNLERLRRAVRIIFFMITMVASLLLVSAPVLVAVGDAAGSLVLASKFACASCYGLSAHLNRYAFRRSLMDIPVISLIRSLVITCVYSLCDGHGLSHGPYLGTATLCSVTSIIFLTVKACVFSPILEMESEDTSSLELQKLYLKKSWGLPVLFLFSLVLALGHVMVAYRTSCRARRKLLFHRIDQEAVLACKNVFSGYTKVPRSPTPCSGKVSRSDCEAKRKGIVWEEGDLPISLLADADSLFIACQGLTLHYKLSSIESPLSHSLSSAPFPESSPNCSPRRTSPAKLNRPMTVPSKIQHQITRSLSNQFHNSSLYAPLLAGSATSPTFFSDEIPVLSLDDNNCDTCLPNSPSSETDIELGGKFGVVLVHGFGGGVFSWRHVMGVLARQIGCTVVAFDRPGWGLTSRPRRKEWEEKQLPNPYKLESQVDLLLSFCTALGFSSVVLVGHDDGGLLVLKAAEKLLTSRAFNVKVKGVVLLSVSLSREVVPAFARILLHTSLGKKHMVRPLLRTEITQVINRRAWYDATKLTTEVLNLYKAPLCIEGWDEALHEIGRLSFSTVLSPQTAVSLLKSVEDMPILVVAGAEDALVSLKSAQVTASGFVNSVSIFLNPVSGPK